MLDRFWNESGLIFFLRIAFFGRLKNIRKSKTLLQFPLNIF